MQEQDKRVVELKTDDHRLAFAQYISVNPLAFLGGSIEYRLSKKYSDETMTVATTIGRMSFSGRSPNIYALLYFAEGGNCVFMLTVRYGEDGPVLEQDVNTGFSREDRGAAELLKVRFADVFEAERFRRLMPDLPRG